MDNLDWDNIICFENLYKAHRRARLGKRHKKEVIEFETNLAENLWALHYDLKYDKYILGDYYKFTIYDPKEREIQAISYRDRVVQHSICDNYLTPLLEKHLIYDNCACRVGRGTSFAIKRLKKFMTKHFNCFGNSGYFVKIDVSKYFASIDHSILKEQLIKIVKNNKIWSLLNKVIDSYNYDTNKGLPMGNQTSQAFALLYLNCVDRFFKEQIRIKFYVRYMDDIIMLVDNKDLATRCLKEGASLLGQLNVNMNPKSQIIKVSRGLPFLGYMFSLNKNGKISQKLKSQTKKRVINKIKYKGFCLRKSPKIIKKKFDETLTSYRGFFLGSSNFIFFKNIFVLSDKIVKRILKLPKST